MTVLKNIRLGLETRKLPLSEINDRCKYALELVKLSSYEERFPHELSGGQQQRVALARALALEPKVLLLDEPLSNLDNRLRTEIRKDLKDLHKRLGITTIYVTHDREDAFFLAHQAAIMVNGQIVQSGDPKELYSSPKTTFVANFLGESNTLRGKIIQSNTGFQFVLHKLSLAIPKPSSLTASLPSNEQNREYTICIRPESIKIIKAVDAAQEALIKEISFHGATTTVSLLFSDNIAVKSTLPTELATHLQQGDKVGVEFLSNGISFVTDDKV